MTGRITFKGREPNSISGKIHMNELIQPLTQPLESFLSSVILFVPNLIAASLLLIIGWIIGAVISRITKEIMIKFKIDHYIGKKTPMFKLSDIFPLIFEWTVYLVFIQASVETLGVVALEEFVRMIISFIPGLVQAVIIVILGYIFAEYLKDQIEKGKAVYSNIMGKAVFWLVQYIAVALALPLVGINAMLVNSILLIIVGALGAGIAIAVGLGLKDVVSDIAKKKAKKFK